MYKWSFLIASHFTAFIAGSFLIAIVYAPCPTLQEASQKYLPGATDTFFEHSGTLVRSNSAEAAQKDASPDLIAPVHSSAPQLSQLLGLEFPEKSLSVLNHMLDGPNDSNWSRGRIYWYMALCYHIKGNKYLAEKWSRRAQREGIPELGEDQNEFWLQFDNWNPPQNPRHLHDRIAHAKRNWSFTTIAQKNTRPAENTRAIVSEIRGSTKSSPSILDRVRLATWELLLGEYTTAHDSLSLPTTAIQSFIAGKKHLEEIEALISSSPELENEISKDPRVAIRLDTARIRMVVFKQKHKLAREKEIERIKHLRRVVRTYRDLNEDLIRWQIYNTLNDTQKTEAAAKRSLISLNKIFDEVSNPTDYHLFDDEPVVEGDTEFHIVETEPTPYSNEPLSMLKALQGLSYFNLIHDKTNPDEDLLKKARIWAKASLADQDNKLNVPDGADPGNLIAKLLLGLVEDATGDMLAFKSNPKLRDEAQRHYKRAKKQFNTFLNLLTAKQFADSTIVSDKAQQKLEHLTNPDVMTKEARKIEKEGRPDAARAVLHQATKRHLGQETAIEAIEIGLRAGLTTEEMEREWKHRAQLEIIRPDSAEAQLALSKILNRRAGEQLGSANLKNVTNVSEELVDLQQTLFKYVDDDKLEINLRMAIKANFALILAHRWALAAKLGDKFSDEKNVSFAYAQAKNAEFYLSSQLEGRDPSLDSASQRLLREALVACRIAAGHLAAMHQKDKSWKPESRDHFAGAAAEAAKLHNSPPVLPLIASPLLRQVFEQSEDGGQKLANDERTKREMVMRCLEALFTARFGSAQSGAEQMEKAVAGGSKNAPDGTNIVDASKLSLAADAFAGESLENTLRAFSILTDIGAAEGIMTRDPQGNYLTEAIQKREKWYAQALTKAIALTTTDRTFDASNLTGPTITACMSRITSPLMAFTFAKSLESYAANIPITERLAHRQMLMQHARDSYMHGLKLLTAERLALRYPHIADLIQASVRALNSPDDFINLADTALRERRFIDAMNHAAVGLSRHPQELPLWKTYITASMERIKTDPSISQDEANLLLSEIRNIENAGLISDFEAAFQSAVILESRGHYFQAQKAYTTAQQHAGTKKEQIASISNAVRLEALTP